MPREDRRLFEKKDERLQLATRAPSIFLKRKKERKGKEKKDRFDGVRDSFAAIRAITHVRRTRAL